MPRIRRPPAAAGMTATAQRRSRVRAALTSSRRHGQAAVAMMRRSSPTIPITKRSCSPEWVSNASVVPPAQSQHPVARDNRAVIGQ